MIMRPNLIPGMKSRGIKRANKDLHYKKLARSYLQETTRALREQRAERQKELANKEYKI